MCYMSIDKDKKCERCRMVYMEELEKCPHCIDLSDSQVIQLIEARKRNNPFLNKIAKLFYILLTIIFIIMITFNNT